MIVNFVKTSVLMVTLALTLPAAKAEQVVELRSESTVARQLARWQNTLRRLALESGNSDYQARTERLLNALERVKNFRSEKNLILPKDLPRADRAEFPMADDDTCVLSGKQTFDKDTFIACRKLIVKEGFLARITHGSIFYVHADEILIQSDAALEGFGENGIEGANGQNAPQSWDTARWNDYIDANLHCDRGDSAPNDRGNPGKDGGPGGDGAIVIFSIQPKKLAADGDFGINVRPGAGGAGGTGGAGADHFYRGTDSMVRQECRDGLCVHHCPKAPDGKPGAPGHFGARLALILTDLTDKDYPHLPLLAPDPTPSVLP